VSRSVFAALRARNTALGLVAGGAAVVLIAVVSVPGLRDLFRFGVLHPDDVALIVAASLVALIWLEALRLIRHRLESTLAPSV
jgi:P-type Ca2+ transporter type 2C